MVIFCVYCIHNIAETTVSPTTVVSQMTDSVTKSNEEEYLNKEMKGTIEEIKGVLAGEVRFPITKLLYINISIFCFIKPPNANGIYTCLIQEREFVILASVSSVVDVDAWWYLACKCNKKVYPDSNMYFCERCDRHVVSVCPRYNTYFGNSLAIFLSMYFCEIF